MMKDRTAFIAALEQRLINGEWLLCTAESCTGGLIANWLTDIAGSSACFVGGVASYANEAKMEFLDVSAETLRRCGAVSPQTAVEMANGVRNHFAKHFDATRLIGVSTTGIAGPGGGSEEKPVGLVYIAISTPNGTHAERFVWEYDRIGNKEASAIQALRLVSDFLAQQSQ